MSVIPSHAVNPVIPSTPIQAKGSVPGRIAAKPSVVSGFMAR
jgi:hypothetical protein